MMGKLMFNLFILSILILFYQNCGSYEGIQFEEPSSVDAPDNTNLISNIDPIEYSLPIVDIQGKYNFKLNQESGNSIKLTWDPVPASVGYSIYKNQVWVAGRKVVSPNEKLEFIDNDVVSGRSYFYRVISRSSDDKTVVGRYSLVGESSIEYMGSMISLNEPEVNEAPEVIDQPPAPGTNPLAPNFNKLSAFPGAQGHGQDTVGGRGGKLLIVDTLEDIMDRNDKKTSLREAVQYTEGPRTVVFAVGGVFQTSNPKYVGTGWKIPKYSISALWIEGTKHGNITIAGQTAPLPGVIIKGSGFKVVNASEIIVRYLKIRNMDPSTPGFGGKESGNVSRAFFMGTSGGPLNNIILDHITSSWQTDDSISIYSGKFDTYKGNHATNITVSNSIVAEGDGRSSHTESGIMDACATGIRNGTYKDASQCPGMIKVVSQDSEYRFGESIWVKPGSCFNPSRDKDSTCNFIHSTGPKAGSLRADTRTDRISFYGNYLAHNAIRNLRLSSGKIDIVNNVVYNWGRYGLLTDKWAKLFESEFNILNNYYKAGPNSKQEIGGSRGALSLDKSGKIKYNLIGNIIEGQPTLLTPKTLVVAIEKIPGSTNKYSVTDVKTILPDTRIQDLSKGLDLIAKSGNFFNCVGDSRWRDSHDTRIIGEFFNNSGRLGIGDNHVRDYSEYKNNLNTTYFTKIDSDADGMADQWERINGLNVGEKDHNKDKNSNGYTNLEEYLATLGCQQ